MTSNITPNISPDEVALLDSELSINVSDTGRGLGDGDTGDTGDTGVTGDSLQNFEQGKHPMLLGFAGSFGSGKDVVGAAVAAKLLGHSGYDHISFADPVKDEASRFYVMCEFGHIRPAFGYVKSDGVFVACPVIETVRPLDQNNVAASIVPFAPGPCNEPATIPNVPSSAVGKVIHYFYKIKSFLGSTNTELPTTGIVAYYLDPQGTKLCLSYVAQPVDAWLRSPAVRRMNQWQGTEVRRREDKNYWAKIGVDAAQASIKANNLVIFTDVRFPNEADAILDAKGAVIRLNISSAIRDQRLMARDGHEPSLEAKNHASERALDGYENFSIIVTNDGKLLDTVDLIVTELLKMR